jgi:Pyruvate/2-oxoacid:ferredoxin oxidoreductase delta subunit
MADVYEKLAEHIRGLVMGYPYSEALIDLLREMFNEQEAEVALGLPNDRIPLEPASAAEVAAKCGLGVDTVREHLDAMAERFVVFSAKLPSGETGYALHQVGYGVPQSFFWSGREDERSRRMAKLILKYFTVPVTRDVYGPVPTKTYKYSPAGLVVDVPMQGVLPYESIESIVRSANRIALAHCPCRMSAKILGRTDCTHSLEVCFKYDEMADFVIDKGLAREVSVDEALAVMRAAEEEGLVHMVDNAQGGIKHTCNCCGHYCWNVGIIRRRKIPRDQLMAVYFIRETDLDECVGCGACADICPVDAVVMNEDNRPAVDMDWCIGCGVCAVKCPVGCISMVRRDDDPVPKDFSDLHKRIRTEKGL